MSEQRHVHFDEAKIEAASAEFCARCAERIAAPGYEGVEARFKNDVMPAFYLRFAKEMNAGTGMEDTANAVSSLVAHVVLTLAMSFNEPDSSLEHKAAVANLLLFNISEFVASRLDGKAFTSVAPEQSGRA